MPILLFAIFLKGPAWLRIIVLAGFGIIIFFACLCTFTTITAIERTVPAHVTHIHKHTARYLRS